MNTLNLYLPLSPLHIRSTPIFPPNPSPSLCYRRVLKLQTKDKGLGTKGALPEKNLQEEDDDGKLSTRSKKEDVNDKIGDEVWGRMIVRILSYVGIPMASGIALLIIFGFLKENHIWDVSLWLALDPNKKGTLLGWEEVQQNWPELWKEDIE
ncbi:hypothetical protein MKX01_038760 [Papaver californicum]|nr:hypothetical protein MKX01_038760 [Papaver californicum]